VVLRRPEASVSARTLGPDPTTFEPCRVHPITGPDQVGREGRGGERGKEGRGERGRGEREWDGPDQVSRQIDGPCVDLFTFDVCRS